MGNERGWFVNNRCVNYCLIKKVDDEGYHIDWSGCPLVVDKRYRFPTMLAAQLFNHRERTIWGAEAHKTDVLFYQELSRKFEEKAELIDHAWIIRWNASETAYKLEYLEWRKWTNYDNLFEVQTTYGWEGMGTDCRFKTEAGAKFYAEAKLLKDRIGQEQSLYEWLKEFGECVDEHGQEIDDFKIGD